MEINFKYERKKDVWCLLNKGKGSNNSPNPTKVYELLVARCGENPDEQSTSDFIDDFLIDNDVSIEVYVEKYTNEWLLIADEYHKRAVAVFGVFLPQDITAYLTINNRNPYSITDNLFYISAPRDTVRKTIMHELWHFYTWYGLGTVEGEKLGKSKYNDVKEALTVLLNEECGDLLPEGVSDTGYPQHQELRQGILDIWRSNKDIKSLWKEITK